MLTIRIVAQENKDGTLQTAVYVDPDQSGTDEEERFIGSIQRQLLAHINDWIAQTQVIEKSLIIDACSDAKVREIHRRCKGGEKP